MKDVISKFTLNLSPNSKSSNSREGKCIKHKLVLYPTLNGISNKVCQ